jgi:hypothetical protein
MKKTVVISLALALLVTVFVSFTATPISVSAQQPTPAPSTSAPPGLYVTSLRVQPAQPAFNQSIRFFPTFANTTQGDFAATWLVYVWKADEVTKTNNETAESFTHFPVGTAEYAAADDAGFKYGPTGRVCEYFFARVAMLDPNNKPIYFTDLAGKTVEQGFAVCDVSVIPTPVPQAAAPTPAPPPPPPGVFVTDMRVSPVIPAFFKDASFNPTFSNTADQVLNFKWKVYIYKTDNLSKSNNETSFLQTAFQPGTAEYPSLGQFSYGATGKSCEDFFTRVGWIDSENKINFFMFPDGRTFEKPFSVCDPLVIPTSVPQAAAPPTPIPPPAPGLFVTDVKLAPTDNPMHNQAVDFTVAFKNTADRELTFPWKVYIYKLDNMNISNNETTKLTTSFPAGAAGDYPSLGSFKYGATGNTCDAFSTRVGWLDENNKINFFMMPDGKMFEKPFSICN